MKSEMMQVFFSVFFCVLSGNLLSDVSTPEDTNQVTPSVVASLDDLPEDTLIARVLDQKIYLKDINPSHVQLEKYGKDKTPEQLEQWQRQQRISALYRYFHPLFEGYVQQKNVKVTETEIDQYNEMIRRTLTSQVEKAQKKVNSLQKELQAANLDEKKRAELSDRLELFSQTVTIWERNDKPAMDATVSEERSEIRNAITEKVIRGWKIKRCLYQQYDGRVIFQQAGPEPLDAYRKFFEDEQKKGHFQFYNKETEDLFWEYYRNEKMHTFISDQVEARKMMKTPPWLYEPDEPLEGEDAGLWGEAADGLCMKIRIKKLVFNTEETATVIVDLLNIGDKIFSCPSLQQFFEIEVDGQWYQWGGPEVADIVYIRWKPKQVLYEFAEIQLADQWVSKETELPLKLDVGQHSLRFRYRPMDVMDKNDDAAEAARARLYKNYKPVEVTPVTSNLAKFKMVPFEHPLSIVLQGNSETVSQIMQWLAKNPRIVRPVLGQKYKVKSISAKNRIDQKIIMHQPDPEIDFNVGIIDPSGEKQDSEIQELNKKLGALIKKQLPEQFEKP